MSFLIESTAFVILFFSFVHYTNRAILIKQRNEEAAAYDQSPVPDVVEDSEEKK